MKNKMTANSKKLIILGICVAILAAVWLVVDNLPSQTDTNQRPTAATSDGSSHYTSFEPIYTVAFDSITDISLTVDGESRSFVKNADVWTAIGTDQEYSPVAINGLAIHLSSLRYNEIAKASYEECGFEESSTYVSFISDSGEITITMGSAVPDTSMYYISVSTCDEVYMIDAGTLRDTIFKPLSEYRKIAFRSVNYDEIVAIEFGNSRCELSLRLAEANVQKGIYYEWRMISPVNVFAKDNEIKDRIITPLSELQTTLISENGDFEKYGLDQNQNYITLVDKSGQSQTIYYSDKIRNTYYLTSNQSNSIYMVNNEGGLDFDTINVIDIADRQLYLTQHFLISTVKITGNKNYTIDFGKENSVKVNGKTTDTIEARGKVFEALSSLLADEISTEPLGPSDFTVTYTLTDGKTVTLTFASENARYYAVARDGKPVYRILKEKVNSMFEQIDKYK